jgi:hypothetical protein
MTFNSINQINIHYFNLRCSFPPVHSGGSDVGVIGHPRHSENGVEELTRWPVHEAFAASVSYNPELGILVRSAPPTLIEEIPPDQRPVGESISWIPGYWGWDDETTDFIWISGVWRNMPTGRQWTPGYWGESESQWQ